eukprot:698661-Pleurochrysis_carterae.AAC.1
MLHLHPTKIVAVSGTIKDGTIVHCCHCIDTGYLFQASRFYKPMPSYKVKDDGKGGDTLEFDKSAQVTWQKSQTARFFGGLRVHDQGIFQSSNNFIAMI